MRYIDLHTHSYFSDGTMSPSEIVSLAKVQQLTHIALTDHDTVKGLAQAQKQAIKENIVLINGIELSAQDDDCPTIHILGYNIKNLDIFAPLEKQAKIDRRVRNDKIIHFLNEMYGINIDSDDFHDTYKGVVGKGNLCQYLKDKGHTPSYQEAMNLLKPFKAGAYGIPVQKAIDLIHSSGGIAFLAHPCTLKLDNEKLGAKIGQFKQLGLDGIECFHSNHTDEQTQFYLNLAQQLNLLISGGSDFHGAFKERVKIGQGKVNRTLVDASYVKWLD